MTILLCILLGDDVSDLVERLGDRDIDVREEATEALKAKGKTIESRLRAIETSDEEVKVRLAGILQYLGQLRRTRALVVEFVIDPHGVTSVILREPLEGWYHYDPDRLVSRGVLADHEYFQLFILGDEPIEWHPTEYVGWRARFLAEIDRPFETDVPEVFHLLCRGRGLGFAIEKLQLKSLETKDPVMKRVILRAIERQK